MSKEKFSKPSLSISKQVALLKKRGLIISDQSVSEHYLNYIGYYRLSGYSRYFYKDLNSYNPYFIEGTTFDQILDLYIFDRELRLLIMDAIERIEVSFRTILSNWMSEKYNPHWYLERKLFLPTFYHKELMQTIEKDTGFRKQHNAKRNSPIFMNYYNKYNDPAYPPSWMLTEGLSLGTWSRIFEYLGVRSDKAAISKSFKLPYIVFQSWMQSMSFLRNICAHHLIIWNRKFHIIPCLPHSFSIEKRRHFMKRHSAYSQLAMINILVETTSKKNHWSLSLKKLFENHHNIPIHIMGFQKDWYLDDFWKCRNVLVTDTEFEVSDLEI